MERPIILLGALLSLTGLISPVLAQPVCVANNGAVPPAANTTDPSAPFYIDTTGWISAPRRPPVTL
jgi:hypothetical protein